MIRLAKPTLGEAELAGVRAVLDSGMLVQGPKVAELESRLAALCGRRHAVACGSGTAALELGIAALRIDSGEVLCPDLSWPSPAHAVLRAGARVRLVDVDEGSWNVTAEALTARRTDSTRAAIVIDQFGTPADHDAIARAIADVPLIVDSACAIGSTLHDKPTASYGAIACLSFHPRKVVTTAEGGACVTDDSALADEMRMLRNHGQRAPGVFAVAAGNHRMTEIAAAIGLAQLERLPTILARRRELAKRYHAMIELPMQTAPEGASPNYQTFGVILDARHDRDVVIAKMRAAGVESGRLSFALHDVQSVGADPSERFDAAERIAKHGIALPLHAQLSDGDQDTVVAALGDAIG